MNEIHAVSQNTFKVYEKYVVKRYNVKQFRWIGENLEEVLEPVPVIEAVTDKIIREYDPLQKAPELLTELLKVDFRNEESVINFVSTYGLPAGENLDKLINENTNAAIVPPSNQRSKAHKKLRLIRFNEVKRLGELSNLWYDIGKSDEKTLGQIIKGFEHSIYDDNRLGEAWETVENEDDNIKARKFLFLKLKERKLGSLDFDMVDGKFSLVIHFDDLFQVASWQLANFIANEDYFKKCQHCNNLFKPLHGHQKFCPPLLLAGRKTSTCQNTHNQRQKRKRKQQQKGEI
ncbi:hypothetical protein K7T73_04305 [Bacillus badius]|uniref:hypothetical protein n=1 Tax=Bacillus badius TaxID=1455 RepID=UPI001CC00721|nr:hypothetical protein [Bacillus badius]UAT31462.1 hypothetical protein K7T73_04305 [Bacillus badius]